MVGERAKWFVVVLVVLKCQERSSMEATVCI